MYYLFFQLFFTLKCHRLKFIFNNFAFTFILIMYRIVLVGFMGSGKTTMGKKIAKKLNIPFIDLDSEIEKKYNLSILKIFQDFGEAKFRDMEFHYIRSLINKSNFVLSTGGGTPCYKNNISFLNELGITCYLNRPIKELSNRLHKSKKKRPLIEGLDNDELTYFISEEMKVREQYYRKSQLILNRKDQVPEKIISLINLLDFHQKN